MHLSKTIRFPSTAPSGTETVTIVRKPKGADVIRKKVQTIIPMQKMLLLDDGHKVVYKYLIQGEDASTSSLKDHPLREALES